MGENVKANQFETKLFAKKAIFRENKLNSQIFTAKQIFMLQVTQVNKVQFWLPFRIFNILHNMMKPLLNDRVRNNMIFHG